MTLGAEMSNGAATTTQAERLLTIQTPAGADVLLVEEFSGAEAVSELFSWELQLLADLQAKKHLSVKPENLVGQPMCLTLALEGGGKRLFHGIVKCFAETGRGTRFANYRAELVPWLWLLTLTQDSRIYPNPDVPDSTVPNIVTSVFDRLKKNYPAAHVSYRVDLRRKYTKWDYCVQYRESGFNFVSRLMEQEGIFYFFEHTANEHTLVMADHPSAHRACVSAAVPYNPTTGYTEAKDTVHAIEAEERLRAGAVTITDYNFQLPAKDLAVSQTTQVKRAGNAALEIYDFPAGSVDRFNAPGERLEDVKEEDRTAARLRMEAQESPHLTITGKSDCRAFCPGFRFELKGHERSELNQQYVITSVKADGEQAPSYLNQETNPKAYSNVFTCIPAWVPYRPACKTPKPVVPGPQTAVVVGKEKEEIWTDKYGRVKVQFHWDRTGKRNQDSSCWLRVAQPWAGKDWGAIWVPRVGQEVVVEFLEGDPDRPIITGSVYNAEVMPPYTLPEHQTVSAIKSRSSKTGAAANFNEIRFEDKKGAEQVFINAERDLDLRVENDAREYVGKDRHLIVKENQRELVEKNHDAHVKGDRTEKVEGAKYLYIGRNRVEQVGAVYALAVGGAAQQKVGAKLSTDVGIDHHEKVGKGYALEAGMTVHIKSGMSLVIESGVSLTVKGPGGFININPAGLFISGNLVMINSGGAPGAGSGANPAAPAPPAAPKDPDIADDGSKFGKCEK